MATVGIRDDRDGNAPCLTVRDGEEAEAGDVADEVCADLDDRCEVLGSEFVNADRFAPFLREGSPGGDGGAIRRASDAQSPR